MGAELNNKIGFLGMEVENPIACMECPHSPCSVIVVRSEVNVFFHFHYLAKKLGCHAGLRGKGD